MRQWVWWKWKHSRAHASVLCHSRRIVGICLWVSVWRPLFEGSDEWSLAYSSATGVPLRKGRIEEWMVGEWPKRLPRVTAGMGSRAPAESDLSSYNESWTSATGRRGRPIKRRGQRSKKQCHLLGVRVVRRSWRLEEREEEGKRGRLMALRSGRIAKQPERSIWG